MESRYHSLGRKNEFVQSARDEGGFPMRQNVLSSSDDHFLDSRSIPSDLDTAHLYLNVTNLQRSCKRLDYLRKEIERKKKKKAQKEKKKNSSLRDSKKFKEIKEKYRDLYNEILVQRVEVDSLFDTPRRRTDENEHYRNHRQSESERHKPKSRQPLPQLDEECEKCREKTKNIWQLEANINSSTRNLQHRIDELEALIKKERSEKEDALRRLSSVASAKLRDNNPNIADLSDPNRPTRIVEKLSEIYDNEWTDAFDHLEKCYSKEEKDNVQLLLDVLIKVHQKCNNLSENILDNIIGPLPTDIPPDVSKNLKDAIKMITPHRMSALAKDIKSSLQSRMKIIPRDPFDIYVDKCIEACLLMSVQDPPMFLSAYPDKDGLFSHTSYRAYTKSGKYELFIVWPVLYLHKNGPMMAKGVAQGTDDNSMIKNNYSRTYQQPVQSQTVVKHHYDYQQRPQQHHHQYKQDWHQYGGMRTSYMSPVNQGQQQYPSNYPASGNSRRQCTTQHPTNSWSQTTDF
ncbi:hypothetical protein CHS0354_018699 [Potamilus streckersoni]|uniref:Mitochondria-eating protein C-terminal domain-containing protein n=1 Tax=Potamilus streckersoni TaxID=2493646 RepID=A0AAE0SKC6_9BIVA|nr:hypothetical protein CHS0354_018699 [Potamilus streckersoni]